MPRSYEEILEEIIANAEGPEATLMEDPSYMQDTMNRGAPKPNQDMAFNPQGYETMRSPNNYNLMMDPTDILDKTGPMTKYDDNQTRQQRERVLEKRQQDYMRQQPELDPYTPPRDKYGIDDIPPPGEAPPQSNMQRLYRQMPQQVPPPSQMPQLPHVPQQNDQQMQQLMDFYTSGGQVEM